MNERKSMLGAAVPASGWRTMRCSSPIQKARKLRASGDCRFEWSSSQAIIPDAFGCHPSNLPLFCCQEQSSLSPTEIPQSISCDVKLNKPEAQQGSCGSIPCACFSPGKRGWSQPVVKRSSNPSLSVSSSPGLSTCHTPF
ncbi:hypothetical protein Anapl_06611 [Anas platyrhynchos]|uniref:Uncharacterized protein n=1 Tax=Anas platyrhynchos TaxID=8839 RepID=R0M045_ANAPL|nr:hypothetical protein Anapl_06611 [Anas platyrhynchos]